MKNLIILVAIIYSFQNKAESIYKLINKKCNNVVVNVKTGYIKYKCRDLFFYDNNKNMVISYKGKKYKSGKKYNYLKKEVRRSLINTLKNKSFKDVIHSETGFIPKYLKKILKVARYKKIEDRFLKITQIKKNKSFNNKKFRIGIIDTGLDRKSINSKDILEEDHHGIHVTGIISFLSKNVEFIVYNINRNEITPDSISKGIEYLSSKKVDIINLSMSGSLNCSYKENQAFKRLSDANIPIVISSGNDHQVINKENKLYPQSYEYSNIFVVGSLDKKGNLSDFSNYGNDVDFYVLGEDIPSLSLFQNKSAIMSGTSQSAPILTSLIVDIMRNDGIRNPKLIKKKLYKIFKSKKIHLNYRKLIW